MKLFSLPGQAERKADSARHVSPRPPSIKLDQRSYTPTFHLNTGLVPMFVPHILGGSSGSNIPLQERGQCDQISYSLDRALTLIDRGEDICRLDAISPECQPHQTEASGLPGELCPARENAGAIASLPFTLGSCLAKLDMYANSRLPPKLPPLRLYMDTYPLLCLAAKYSDSVYEQPRGANPGRDDLKKCLFLSVINEGGPVARADKEYVKSLLELLVSPAPLDISRAEDGKDSKTPSRLPQLRCGIHASHDDQRH